MMRKDLIEARDDIAKRLLDFKRELCAGIPVAPGKVLAMQSLCGLHDVFARQLDQSFFEPVSTMHEMHVVSAIGLLEAIREKGRWGDLEMQTCIDNLKHILPKEPASTGIQAADDGR